MVVCPKDVSVLISGHVILHYLDNKEDFSEMIKRLQLEKKSDCILSSQAECNHKSSSMSKREAESGVTEDVSRSSHKEEKEMSACLRGGGGPKPRDTAVVKTWKSLILPKSLH